MIKFSPDELWNIWTREAVIYDEQNFMNPIKNHFLGFWPSEIGLYFCITFFVAVRVDGVLVNLIIRLTNNL